MPERESDANTLAAMQPMRAANDNIRLKIRAWRRSCLSAQVIDAHPQRL
jgi:hypothetical protein